MHVKLASSYGFCFGGVKRAIKIAEGYENSATMGGPLIHNQNEIDRLKK